MTTTSPAAPSADPRDNPSVDRGLIDSLGHAISREMGWPLMAGRVAMALMLSGQKLSIAQLREMLDASSGSISESTRTLITAGVIERIREPGRRQHAFGWRKDAWAGCMNHQAGQMRNFQGLAASALSGEHRLTKAQQESFERMLEFYTFLAANMAAIAEQVTSMFEATGRYVPVSLPHLEVDQPSARQA